MSRPVGHHIVAVSRCRRDLVFIMQLTSLAQPALSAQRAVSAHVLSESNASNGPMHGLEALTVISFLSPGPSPTTYNMSGAGRRCSCRAAPLSAPARSFARAPRPRPRSAPPPEAGTRARWTCLRRTRALLEPRGGGHPNLQRRELLGEEQIVRLRGLARGTAWAPCS
jgi:hypothetical protein